MVSLSSIPLALGLVPVLSQSDAHFHRFTLITVLREDCVRLMGNMRETSYKAIAII